MNNKKTLAQLKYACYICSVTLKNKYYAKSKFFRIT